MCYEYRGYQVGDRLLQDLSDHFLQYIEVMLAGRSQLYAIGVGEWACVFRSEYDSEYIHKKFSQFVERLCYVSCLQQALWGFMCC